MHALRLTKPSVFALALLAAPMVAAPFIGASAQISIGLRVNVAPPPLPIYVPPPLPAPGYLWVPGYWAYGDDGYYWVPGTWVEPPQPGLLWTPGYWGWNDGVYVFNQGYWGPHVGYYGGINYGFGYFGVGFGGGEWRGGVFAYNRAAGWNFGNTHVTNVYNNTTVINHIDNHASFNGPGGIAARPTPTEEAFAHERHIAPTENQMRQVHLAATNPQLRASVNHGAPAIAATPRPGEFQGAGVVHARAAGGPIAPAVTHAGPAARPEEHRAAEPAHVAPHEAAPHPEARPEEHRADAARPVPHNVAPRPEARPVEHRATEAPRPEARAEARPEARAAAPHPASAPHPVGRPAPAPRPAPHPAARGGEHEKPRR